ncbi:acyltransferase family protein [Buttiauxella selenatireducens]|uniref:Acyltransferase family protein n=1 Tax=Buttiauxella selenatireducens TaxID=3073902 RepID=A0ABY9S7Z3_9ENTR|nr:acyltransferase family protein [Buttiauxella sp. R73]WMY73118.1 acyltransferase family protein [Buttiauxella sp. R73]
MNNKIRYEWVDALKFLGIFAIYIGHFGTAAGKIYPFVFSYHVPLFFFAAGFFSKNKNTPLHQFTIDKAKRLLLPYFSFAFMTLAITSLNAGGDFRSLINASLDILYGVRNNPFVGSIWFINCLFAMIIIDNLFVRLFKNNFLILCISILSFAYTQTLLSHNPLVEPKWFWNVDSALAYWWLLAMGRCMFKELCENRFFGKSIAGVVIFILLAGATAYQLLNGNSLITTIANRLLPVITQSQIFAILNSIISTTILILFNIFIAKIISKSEFIINAGKNTLNICGLEYITKLLIPATAALLGLSFGIPSVISAILYTLICLYISNIIGYWLSDKIGYSFSINVPKPKNYKTLIQ